MFRRFLADRRGNYALMTVIVMLPLMGALAVGVDYAEMSRQRALALNALDAASIGTARRYLQGDLSDSDLLQYAEDFFAANAAGLDPDKVTLALVLPTSEVGGGTVKLTADMDYTPYFLPVLTSMLGSNAVSTIEFEESSEVRLKNTLEVAMALDNSGSMSENGGSSGTMRMDLLKAAAKQLVDTLAAEGNQMKQVDKPVQFSLVPFASSVNVGASHATETWLDQDGISPVHHENFDWSTMSSSYNATKYVQQIGGVWYKKGAGWGADENQPMTRFSLYRDMQRTIYTTVPAGTSGAEYVCTEWRDNGSCRRGYWRTTAYGAYSAWKGCVEARPYPDNVKDTAPSTAVPATLFVPMFAPDEASGADAYNSWWPDVSNSSSASTRQKYMPKYYTPYATGVEGASTGPGQPCTTVGITKLTDVTVTAGKDSIKAAIDAMQPLGGTNVPEGMAWGWRTISHGVPFTEGRPESEKGNDKVLIVVTDGANTYYTPSSLGYDDDANNKSIYSALGYAGKVYDSGSKSRIFLGTTVSSTSYTNSNYTTAMNEHFATLCNNAKAAKVMVMTVALDLNASNSAEAAQITMLQNCSSESRFTPGKKLFWNSTGASLAEDFKQIGNELSNLRIVG